MNRHSSSKRIVWTFRFSVLLLATLICLRVGYLRPILSLSICSVSEEDQHESNASVQNQNGATARRFSGHKVRTFPRQYVKKFGSYQEKLRREHHHIVGRYESFAHCKKWVVITTIYDPSDAVRRVAEHLTDWCLVIVADSKTPEAYMQDANISNERTVFLSVNDQKQLALMFPFVNRMPYQSFARKNIGYLFAIMRNATVIFDLDDDNILRLSSSEMQLDPVQISGKGLLEHYSSHSSMVQTQKVNLAPEYPHKVWNPFPLMGASLSGTWPRGFPLNLIQTNDTQGFPGSFLSLPTAQIGIIQSVCNQDPDVDAVYRLTRQLPFDFHTSTPLVIPGSLFTPYNAQATLHFPSLYWGMYLPMTVTGRVSDIWRSFIVQRLMRDLSERMHILYSPPMVTQIRNAHDYIGDMGAEQQLYLQTEALLDFLDSWTSRARSLEERIVELWVALYERGFVDIDDVFTVQEWLQSLHLAGYRFPTVRES